MRWKPLEACFDIEVNFPDTWVRPHSVSGIHDGQAKPSIYMVVAETGVCPEAQLTQLTHKKREVATEANKVC